MSERTILQEIEHRASECRRCVAIVEALCQKVLAGYDCAGILTVSVWSSGVTFYTDHKDHHVAARLMLAFGGRFDKKVDADYETATYKQIRDDILIEIQSGPPPNCRIEVYDEVLPARAEPLTIQRKRLVCT